MSYLQLNIFDRTAGENLAKVGLELAVETANKKEKTWSKTCWQLFLWWLRRRKRYEEFMIEDFRRYVYEYDLLDHPPSERAFGFLSKQALKGNFIEWVRSDKVKNKKAHATPANVWRKK